jgi:large subunit ribosomal protein L4
MQLTVVAPDTQSPTEITVNDDVFAKDFNESLVHQVVNAYLAGGRQGTHQQKTRAEVRGGGRKPWRQKGTGRARAGSTRSPIWVGGGKIHAARPQSYQQKVNKKSYRVALRCILSELQRQQRLVVVDALEVKEAKTKLFVQFLQKLSLQDSKRLLVIAEGYDETLDLATRNLSQLRVLDVLSLDPVSLVGAKKILISVAALKMLEEKLQ